MKHLVALCLFVVVACGGKSKPAEPPPPPAAACVPGGCSNHVCGEEGSGLVTTCEYKDEYACYQSATCERQADGECGWSPTPELEACLASPPTQQSP